MRKLCRLRLLLVLFSPILLILLLHFDLLKPDLLSLIVFLHLFLLFVQFESHYVKLVPFINKLLLSKSHPLVPFYLLQLELLLLKVELDDLALKPLLLSFNLRLLKYEVLPHVSEFKFLLQDLFMLSCLLLHLGDECELLLDLLFLVFLQLIVLIVYLLPFLHHILHVTFIVLSCLLRLLLLYHNWV